MVGVPGRSKGCNTCLRRRVKCDEVKPSCLRCAKAGVECLGYARVTQWRHTPVASTPATQPQYSNEVTKPAFSGVVKMSPARELSLSAFEGVMCFAKLFQNFVWRTFGTTWMEYAAKGKVGDLSLCAAKAVSQVNFGRQNRRPDVELKGAVQYGKCLRILSNELKDGAALVDRGQCQELVIPIMLLMIYASLQSDRVAATSHLKGVARMLKVCGPEAFQRQPLRNAFESARATLLVASLFSKQQMFLDDPRWQTIPWETDLDSKSPQSHLLDIFVAIPGLLEENKRLEESMHHSDEELPDVFLILDDDTLRRAELSARIVTQIERLYRWRWDWHHRYGYQVTLNPSGWDPDGEAVKALGPPGHHAYTGRLQFACPILSSDIMLYNSVLMWLQALLWKMEPLLAGGVIEDCARRTSPSFRPSSLPRCSFSHSGHSNISSTSSPDSWDDDTDKDSQNLSSLPSPRPVTSIPHSSSIVSPPYPLRLPGASHSIRDAAVEICRSYEWQSRHHGRCTSSANHHQHQQHQTCLYLFPVGMARCVLEGERCEPAYAAWIQAMLDASPVTSGYARGAGRSNNVARFGDYVTKEALYPESGGATSLGGAVVGACG